ncbi:MAG TPA: hypothetical protein VME20_11105 [Acidimicrobiales bacterium]|nr:hypothetical protein [Acidimicrobiales bacterium]
MHPHRIVAAVTLALGASVPVVAGAAVATAQVAPAPMAAMTVSRTGTFEKLLSMSSFELKVGMKSYAVKTNAMTHITDNGMKERLSSLKKGETLTVKGELEMGTILATSVVVGR